MTSASLRALLTGLVDYAGLFPPAKLDMHRAVAKYAQHRASPHAYAISRFILPVSRLNEFAAAAAPHLALRQSAAADASVEAAVGTALPRTVPAALTNGGGGNGECPPDPWTLSVLIDGPLDQNLRTIQEFNQAHYHSHHYSAVVDTLEVKVATPEAIEFALDRLPEELYPFFEIPVTGDVRGFATALAGTGGGAKIRTGGITSDLFPSIEQVCDFLFSMNASDVQFKATAGLHHPIRDNYPLTYEPEAPTCVMHGFINLFLAAAMIRELDIDRATAMQLLGEHTIEPFNFEDQHVSWRGLQLSTAQLEDARENFCICFGSCSFTEPIEDLVKLGQL
jgi:hypothetical protein